MNEPKCSLLDYLFKYCNIFNFELEYIAQAAKRNVWVQLLNHSKLRQNNDKTKYLCTVTVEKKTNKNIQQKVSQPVPSTINYDITEYLPNEWIAILARFDWLP